MHVIDWAVFLVCLVGAYLLGSIPAAYLIVRWRRGIDLRKYGSGNVGASNAIQATSRWWGIPVVLFDAGKGVLAVWVSFLLGLNLALSLAVGVAAVVGHNWPIFLNFKGGRGILTLLGVSFFLAPKLLSAALAFAVLLGLFKQMALGTIIGLAALPVCAYCLPDFFGIKYDPFTLSMGFLALFLLSAFRRVALRRSPESQGVNLCNLIIFRLLFDRDIRDREAWIKRRTPAVSAAKEKDKTK